MRLLEMRRIGRYPQVQAMATTEYRSFPKLWRKVQRIFYSEVGILWIDANGRSADLFTDEWLAGCWRGLEMKEKLARDGKLEEEGE